MGGSEPVQSVGFELPSPAEDVSAALAPVARSHYSPTVLPAHPPGLAAVLVSSESWR